MLLSLRHVDSARKRSHGRDWEDTLSKMLMLSHDVHTKNLYKSNEFHTTGLRRKSFIPSLFLKAHMGVRRTDDFHGNFSYYWALVLL